MLRTIWRFSCREVRSKLYSDKWLGRRRAKKKKNIIITRNELCSAQVKRVQLFFFILLLRRDILSFEVALYVAIPTD